MQERTHQAPYIKLHSNLLNAFPPNLDPSFINRPYSNVSILNNSSELTNRTSNSPDNTFVISKMNEKENGDSFLSIYSFLKKKQIFDRKLFQIRESWKSAIHDTKWNSNY